MKLMHYDRIARKYHLSWNANKKTIVIQIHKDCLQWVKPIPNNSRWIHLMDDQHEFLTLFDSFSGDLSSDSFGFQRSIVKMKESKDYAEFALKLPRIRVRTQFSCEDCGGTGKRLHEFAYPTDKCIMCRGSGKKWVTNWRSAYAASASFGLLCNILDSDQETNAVEAQHISVTMLADQGQHGSSLGGCFGVDFIDYIYGNKFEVHNIIHNVTAAMQAAHRHMFGFHNYDNMCIRAESDRGSVGLRVPGDACGINTGFDSYEVGRGREFGCHNVDTPLQSLTLLAGLASFGGQVGSYIDTRQTKLAST
jgi:hypothetical protein